MKTIAKTLFAALLFSTASFASDVPAMPAASVNPTAITSSYKVAVYPSTTTPSKLNVMVERTPGKPMEIHLRNAEGQILATQYVGKKEGNVWVKFDLAALEDGTYRVELVSGSDHSAHPIELSTKTVQANRTIALK
jgi:hypothetical protein